MFIPILVEVILLNLLVVLDRHRCGLSENTCQYSMRLNGFAVTCCGRTLSMVDLEVSIVVTKVCECAVLNFVSLSGTVKEFTEIT